MLVLGHGGDAEHGLRLLGDASEEVAFIDDAKERARCVGELGRCQLRPGFPERTAAFLAGSRPQAAGSDSIPEH